MALFQTNQAINQVDTLKLPKYDFRLSSGDIVSIRVGSLTNSKFDFIHRYAMQLGEHLYLSPFTKMNNTSSGGNQSTQSSSGGSLAGGKQDALPSPQQHDKSIGFLIQEEGEILLPEIGRVKLSGLTIREAEKMIQEKLLKVFTDPFVRVQILNFQFTIAGEVSKPNKYTTYQPKTTLISALAMSGSFTEYADRGKVKIIRQLDGGYVVSVYVDLLSESFLSSPFYYVHPNDMIFVEPLNAKAYRNYGSKDISTTIQIISATASITAIILSIINNK